MKLPQTEKLPSGAVRVRVQVDGRRVSRTFATEKEALAFAATVKAGMARPGASVTLGQSIDAYIAERRNVLSPSTVRGYQAIKRYRFTDMMDKRLSSVTDAQWQAAVNREAKLCSSKTLKNAWRFIASVIGNSGYVVPRVRLPQVVSPEKPFLQPDDIPVFIRAVHGTKVEIPALLALHGLRRSELLALTWDMVDLEKGVIHIAGSVVLGPDGSYVRKKENKNTASRRDVPILIPELSSALESADHDAPIIPYAPNSIIQAVNKVCKKNGLPEVGVHGLRHSFASLCYHLGVPEKTVMRLGGWSDDTTMRRIYTHLAQQDMDSDVASLKCFFLQNGHEMDTEISNPLQSVASSQ